MLSDVLVSAETPLGPSCNASCGPQRCSDMSRLLAANPNYVCHRCNSEVRPIDGITVTREDIDLAGGWRWWWGGGGVGGANTIEWDKENTSIYKWIWNADPIHLNIFAS